MVLQTDGTEERISATSRGRLTEFAIEALHKELVMEQEQIQSILHRYPRMNRRNVASYEERWFQYLLLKAVREIDASPSPLVEDRAIDFLFANEAGQPLATFEFKGPFQVSSISNLCCSRIGMDFTKQIARQVTLPFAEIP